MILGLTYTIGTLSGLTGLSQHTIRAWERRYNALTPGRSDTNRRIYSEEDLHRLSLLKRAIECGHRISHVAQIPTERLRTIDSPIYAEPSLIQSTDVESAGPYLASCLNSLSRFDPEGFEEALVRGNAALGILGLLDGVVIPLIYQVEARCIERSLSISQEHMMSAVLRTFLDKVRTSMPGSQHAPRILVTTPRSQLHELGALMVSIIAATQTWSVLYLGTNLPAEEIANGVYRSSARAVALSIVFPTDDQTLDAELRLLRAKLGSSTSIIVGGRAAHNYAGVLEEIGAIVCPDLWALRDSLSRIGLAKQG